MGKKSGSFQNLWEECGSTTPSDWTVTVQKTYTRNAYLYYVLVEVFLVKKAIALF